MLCFDLITPPIFEAGELNTDFKQRVGCIRPGQDSVAPYCHHLRIVLNKEESLSKFEKLCTIAEFRSPNHTPIETLRGLHCSPKQIDKIHKWINKLTPWPVAFQVATLLHNGLVDSTYILNHLRESIELLCKEDQDIASTVLRYFTVALQSASPMESHIDCLEKCRTQVLEQMRNKHSTEDRSRRASGNFDCHHVCITPTRFLLEGPYGTPSNRIIRQYRGYEDHFLRVEFRDEDKMQYLRDRDVDSKTILEERVGEFLKKGIKIAGRNFQFLAYSNSALR